MVSREVAVQLIRTVLVLSIKAMLRQATASWTTELTNSMNQNEGTSPSRSEITAWNSRTEQGRVFRVRPKSLATSYDDLQQCIERLTHPGDECRLASGVYDFSGKPPIPIQSKHGNETNHITVASEQGAAVRFSGTAPVKLSSPWKQDGGVWYATVDPMVVQLGGITQLFDGDSMYTPARWPDALWRDGSMFFGPERWAQFNSSEHNVTTGFGKITDGGTCNPMPKPTQIGAHCDRMPGLGESGINATGAVAVLNMWGCDSGAQVVTHHVPGSSTLIYNATHYVHCDKERMNGRYYLVGKREFVTQPTEWMYDQGTATLFLVPEEGKSVESLSLNAKFSSWAINITDSSYITVANITFFATALLASDAGLNVHPPPDPAPYPKPPPAGFISHIQLEGLQFDYPAASKRMLGSILSPDTVTLYAPQAGPSSPEFRNLSLFNCTFYGSDGPPVLIFSDYVSVSQCLFNQTDWSGVGAAPNTPGRDGHMCTLTISGRSAHVTRSTFANNGNSACLCASKDAHISLCHFYGQAEIQADGTHIEASGEENITSYIVHNWSRNTGKAALRLDAPFTQPPGPVPPRTGGFIQYNVGINTSGIAVKGGGHVVDHNTAVDNTYILANDPTVSYMFQKPGDPLNTTWPDPRVRPCLWSESQNSQEGASTVFTNNAADSIHLGNSQLGSGNVIGGFDAAHDLRDVWNLDFRPCSSSLIASKNAGAYSSDSSKPYWIPGRQLWQPSMPIPADGSTDVFLDTDLMFLGALNVHSHFVYAGHTEDDLQLIGHLHAEENVVNIRESKQLENLSANNRVYWRVDATVHGEVIQGKLWSFTTGLRTSC